MVVTSSPCIQTLAIIEGFEGAEEKYHQACSAAELEAVQCGPEMCRASHGVPSGVVKHGFLENLENGP